MIHMQIKEMQNQMNKRFDENEKMIKNIHNDFDNINKKNININNANIEKININNLFPLVPKNHKIEQNFDFKPLIGLDFIGAPIFLNATLQCFCNIKEFVDYFKYNQALIDQIKQDTQNYTLCRSFKLLIENLYPHELSKIGKNRASIKKKYSYSPNDFIIKISKMKPYLNNIKDFINFFIEQIHMEVNRVPMKNIIGNNLDKTNKINAFSEFSEYFMDNYCSIISDLFYAVNCKSIECILCKTSLYAYKIFSFLSFPLEQVKYFVQEKSINLFQSIDIYQCFEYDKRLIKMEYYCISAIQKMMILGLLH